MSNLSNAPRQAVTDSDRSKTARVKDSSGSITTGATIARSKGAEVKSRTYSVVYKQGSFSIKGKPKRP